MRSFCPKRWCGEEGTGDGGKATAQMPPPNIVLVAVVLYEAKPCTIFAISPPSEN